MKKINGRKVTKKKRLYVCCVCGEKIWKTANGVDLASICEEYDLEVRPGEWVITCSTDICIELLHMNPLAYEDYIQPIMRNP